MINVGSFDATFENSPPKQKEKIDRTSSKEKIIFFINHPFYNIKLTLAKPD
jgi:hypothetical protein